MGTPESSFLKQNDDLQKVIAHWKKSLTRQQTLHKNKHPQVGNIVISHKITQQKDKIKTSAELKINPEGIYRVITTTNTNARLVNVITGAEGSLPLILITNWIYPIF